MKNSGVTAGFLADENAMVHDKYATEYPAILKEQATAAGVKIKKADYRFLDHFLLLQKDLEMPPAKVELLKDTQELEIDFVTAQKATIHMKMAAHSAVEIEFTSHVVRISARQADRVSRQIISGEFIDNFLALQLTIKPVDNAFFDIIMNGRLWIDCHKKSAPNTCGFYLFNYVVMLNEIYPGMRSP